MAAETYGMTPAGFVPKRLVDIITDINAKIIDIVDPATGEFPFLNVEDDAVQQQIIAIIAEQLAEAWGAAADGAVQFDPLKNTGAGQSGTVQLNAILRAPGTPTSLEFSMSGTPLTVVPAGSLIGTADGKQSYALQSDVQFPAAIGDETATTAIGVGVATELAAYNPTNGSVNTIQTPIGTWLTAENTRTISVGTEQESDASLRTRQQRSTSLTSYRQIEAIWSAVMNVPGVTYARCYQNVNSNPTDANGVPYKEVATVVEGGDEQEIADALFLRFPVSVQGFGSITKVCYDKQGVAYNISFSRPTAIPVYIKIDLLSTNPAVIPGNYAQLIKQAIIQYVQYGNTDSAGIGFPPGADIIVSRLYTPINTIQGFSVTSLVIGTTPTELSSEDISIAWNEVGIFSEDRIEITMSGENVPEPPNKGTYNGLTGVLTVTVPTGSLPVVPQLLRNAGGVTTPDLHPEITGYSFTLTDEYGTLTATSTESTTGDNTVLTYSYSMILSDAGKIFVDSPVDFNYRTLMYKVQVKNETSGTVYNGNHDIVINYTPGW